jgi:hypothetical protein
LRVSKLTNLLLYDQGDADFTENETADAEAFLQGIQ